MIQKGFQITKIETVMQNVFAAAAASSTGEPRQLLKGSLRPILANGRKI